MDNGGKPMTTTQQILSLVCGGWIIFMLGFFTACLLAAAARGRRDIKDIP